MAAAKLAKAILLGEWVLATGFYIDDLELMLQKQREVTEQQIYADLLSNALITLVLVALVIFIGALAQAFNQFSGKVATLIGQAQSSMRTLGQSAEHLAAINEMSATAEDVAKSASQAAQAANHAETQVHEANVKLHRAISVIGDLEQQVQVT